MRFPDDTQRAVIVGTTGSGKTFAGAYHLSRADFVTKPWIIYDFKRDPLLGRIEDLEGSYTIETKDMPEGPGLYFVHPHPDDGELVQDQLRRVWEQRNIGIYVDEGYMVSTSPNKRSWFRTLLTQGRSLHIPIITLAQRPSWIDRFIFTESEFIQIFRLNWSNDRKKMMEFVPADLNRSLPDFHSYYHDVGRNETVVMRPVPDGDGIVELFERRLEVNRKPKRRAFI